MTPEAALAALDADTGPDLTPEQVRQLLRECVTVVKPGETLIIRVPLTWTPTMVSDYNTTIQDVHEMMELPFRAMVVPAEGLAVAEPESDADLIKRIERVWPTLQARNMRRTAMNLPGRARPSYPG